jgi:hypothetical protein
MKKIILLMVALFTSLTFICSDALARGGYGSSGYSSGKSYNSSPKTYSAPKSYGLPKSSTPPSFTHPSTSIPKNETLKTPGAKPYESNDSGGTRYKSGETYKSTGLPKVDRSQTAKENFLKQRGLDRVPSGYEVDHIVPLHKGGSDTPSNMQLLPKELHQQKTAAERQGSR